MTDLALAYLCRLYVVFAGFLAAGFAVVWFDPPCGPVLILALAVLTDRVRWRWTRGLVGQMERVGNAQEGTDDARRT